MLLYSAISKGSLILCDYCESDEDLKQLTQKQLKSIRKTQEMQTFQSDGYCLFVLQQQEYNYMCITQWKKDIQPELKLAQQFLNQIAFQFSQASQSSDFDSGQFTKNLAEIMQLYKQKEENHAEEQQQNQEISLQRVRQENPQLIQKSSSSYSVYTCKSLFFIINLFMAGMLIEFLNKLNKQK